MNMTTPPPTTTQLSLFDLDAGRTRRDAGMQRAAENAEGAEPGWADYALGLLRSLCERQPTVHVDDLSAICERQPASPNAWGAVWQRARRRGLIAKTGHERPTRLPGKHAHSMPIYRSLVYRQAAQRRRA